MPAVGHRGQGGFTALMLGEEAGVDYVEVSSSWTRQSMLSTDAAHGPSWTVGSRPGARSRRSGYRFHVREPVKQVVGLHVEKVEHRLELTVLNCLLRKEQP